MEITFNFTYADQTESDAAWSAFREQVTCYKAPQYVHSTDWAGRPTKYRNEPAVSELTRHKTLSGGLHPQPRNTTFVRITVSFRNT
jgi:hypothetical protein